MGMARSVRLVKLLNILSKQRPYLTASALAEELGVTERTIYRDLLDLGYTYPIYHDRGYKMHKSHLPPSWSLTPMDVRIVQLLLQSSPLSKHEDYKAQVDNLILKLKTLAQPQSEGEFVPIHSAEASPAVKRTVKMRDLERALSKNLACEVLYQALEETEPHSRTLQPYAMAIREGKWYLIARNAEAGEIHSYRLERIHRLRVTDKKFKREPHFSIEQYFEDSWSVFRGKKQTVKLRLEGMAIRMIQERDWLEQSLKQTGENEAICTLKVQGTEEILAWALSMAPHVEILEPKELREQMKITLGEILKKLKSTDRN
ncbi:WYL domain-containing protein [bacterium]|nr:WYL domain-containing protein [bacterium]